MRKGIFAIATIALVTCLFAVDLGLSGGPGHSLPPHVASSPVKPTSPAHSLLAAFGRGSQIEHVEISRMPTAGARAYAIRFDWERNWWGSWGVAGLSDGLEVEWVATVSRDGSQESGVEVTEQSIDSLKTFRLPGLPHPFVEVVGTTHMGHGNLYLYEFVAASRQLSLRLKTFVLDRHENDSLIANGGVLRRVYRDVNTDGYTDVEIQGCALLRSESDRLNEVRAWKRVNLRKVFLWSPKAACFKEMQSDRQGFAEAYPGRI